MSDPQPSAEAIALLKELREFSSTPMRTRDSYSPAVIIDRYLAKAREEGRAEADAAAIDDWRIESHIQECAVTATKSLERNGLLSRKGNLDIPIKKHQADVIAIICEAFGCKQKDECETALTKALEEIGEIGGKSAFVSRPDFVCGFKAAWKIAKESK